MFTEAEPHPIFDAMIRTLFKESKQEKKYLCLSFNNTSLRMFLAMFHSGQEPLILLVGVKYRHVLGWPNQSLKLNPIQDVWQDLKIDVHTCSSLNLSELQLLYKD